MLPFSTVDTNIRQGKRPSTEPDSSHNPPPMRHGKKRRNVIESSPSQGEAPSDAPSEDDDELDDLIDSQFVSIREAQPDDPQVDWRTQATTRVDIQVEDDILSDPDELSEVEDEPEPPKSLKAIEDGIPSQDPAVLQVHVRYLEFLVQLCERTETTELTSHIRHGLPPVIHRAQSLKLNQDLRTAKDLDTYAFALVVYILLVAAYRMQHGLSPNESLVAAFGSYMLSASTVVEEYCKVPVKELRLAVLYWERRLNNASTRVVWIKEGWFRDITESPLTNTFTRNDTAPTRKITCETRTTMPVSRRGVLTNHLLKQMDQNLSISVPDLGITKARSVARNPGHT